MESHSARRAGRALALAGATLVVSSHIFAGAFSIDALLLGLWAMTPYVVLLALSSFWRDLPGVLGAGLAVLAGELGFRLAAFVFPAGSTAAIALLFSPFYLTVLALPAGALGGWLVGRCWRLSRIVGGLAAFLLLSANALFTLSLAQPESTPWARRERNRWQDRLGVPRVALQPDDWERRPIPESRGWVQTGDLDGEPGDEVVLVDHRRALLLDPSTFAIREELEHGSDQGSRWSWYSRLARFDEGRRVIVQTGGGYQETEVFDLDGRRLWRYRPDPELPPSTLRPWDLDGDGRTDLVAIDGARLVRLDQSGRELWVETVPYASDLVLSGASSLGDPPWIVTKSQKSLTIRNGEGQTLGSLELDACSFVAVLDLGHGRRILCGEEVLSTYDLRGTRELQIPLNELTLVQATAARLVDGQPPYLATVAAAPRDVDRWRIAIHEVGPDSASSSPVYEEIVDRPPRLHVARRSEGNDVLLLHISGSELWVLRPRRSGS